MDRIIDYIKTEPVRVRAYALILLVGGYLVLKGYVQPEDKEFIISLAALILGVERTRAKVSPTVYEPKHRA